MLTTRAEILSHLTSLGIATETFDHPPVFTVEESQQHTAHLPGAHCKNLFLKDKKDRLWLVTCGDEQQVDLNRLSKALGAARFSFGRSDLLHEVLGVEPGSVTPLAIVNDSEGRVTHVLDAKLAAQDIVNCHPLRNDATTAIRGADLLLFIRSTGHEPVLLDLDAL